MAIAHSSHRTIHTPKHKHTYKQTNTHTHARARLIPWHGVGTRTECGDVRVGIYARDVGAWEHDLRETEPLCDLFRALIFVRGNVIPVEGLVLDTGSNQINHVSHSHPVPRWQTRGTRRTCPFIDRQTRGTRRTCPFIDRQTRGTRRTCPFIDCVLVGKHAAPDARVPLLSVCARTRGTRRTCPFIDCVRQNN